MDALYYYNSTDRDLNSTIRAAGDQIQYILSCNMSGNSIEISVVRVDSIDNIAPFVFVAHVDIAVLVLNFVFFSSNHYYNC
jgi:hypothetical protein